jgi:hypothetical protein
MMIAFVLGVVLLGAIGGLFMPALLLDVVSFWPLYGAGVFGAGVAWWIRGKRPAGVQVIPPVFILTWVLGAVALHFLGWEALPSASGDLEGPVVGASQSADFATTFLGHLEVTSGGDLLYEITLERRAGTSGVPEALESVDGSTGVVRVREQRDNGWFRTSGWNLTLAVRPSWVLDLEASDLDADLRGLSLTAAAFSGSGVVLLPTPTGATEIELAGDFTVSVPAGFPAEVVGSARVPDSWVATETGWRAPVSGDGHRIAVGSGTVEVVER